MHMLSMDFINYKNIIGKNEKIEKDLNDNKTNSEEHNAIIFSSNS